jgi:single-strand DNA-binding protein
MSRDYSKVILIGNIESDFSLRKTNLVQTPVTNIVLSTSDTWETKEGVVKTYKKWHHIVCWGRLAEYAVENFEVGDTIIVEGTLSYRYRDDKNFKVAEIKASSIRKWEGSFNKVILIGNVSSDPILNKTTTDVSVTNFTMTTIDRWKNKNQQVQYHTKWHKLVCWKKLAEIVVNTIRNGALILVEGTLSYKTFINNEGIKNNHIAEVKTTQLVKWANPISTTDKRTVNTNETN